MSVSAYIMFGLFFAWCFLGMPIGHAMLVAAIVYLFMTGQDIGLVASQSMNGLYSSFVLMSVPQRELVAADAAWLRAQTGRDIILGR